jgi:phytoene/squalene synthetase
MVDKDLVDDCYRAYGYFRWTDDVVDVLSRSSEERISFIKRQWDLIDRAYRNERPDDLTPEEEIIVDLISHDRDENSGLQSFIRNFLAVIEFDAHRKGSVITQDELTWYSRSLGTSVTDCIQYFVGNGHPYPDQENRYLAATAASITHMLRDLSLDIPEGFINIPREFLEVNNINLENVDGPPFRGWVRDQVEQAREYFRAGKRYLEGLDVLRCKIVGYWYCARFEGVLDAIERDGYKLRTAYRERRRLSNWLKIPWLSASVAFRHVARRGQT